MVQSPKGWYIIYYIWNIDDEKLERKRVKVIGHTEKEKLKDSDEIIGWLTKELKSGAYVGGDPTNENDQEQLGQSGGGLGKNMTYEDAVAYYFKTKRDIAEGTTGLYQTYVNHLRGFLEKKKKSNILLRYITKPLILEFLDQIELAGKTKNNILGFHHSFFEVFVDREIIEKNPVNRIKKSNVEESEDHLPFTPEQIKELKNEILGKGDEQLWLFCQFIYYTFARPGQEIRLLQVKDILPESIRITAKRGKTNRFRYPFLSPALEAEIIRLGLRKYPPDYYVFSNQKNSDNPRHPNNFKVIPGPTPPGKNSYYNRHVRHLKKLGLFGKDYDIYSWKPTGVIALWSATLDLKLIQGQCGHSTVAQTDQYLKKLGLVIRPEKLNEFPTI
ncbi:hypothetical protein [Larkinella sp. C7]|uniref:tyrosine-type recombinase/integrase n=1 Tax=Larkinella sp. C7 TaxID=2576607 RepID=UPI00111127F6|nr:hypothetical protein [Larkinella sp. C7]